MIVFSEKLYISCEWPTTTTPIYKFNVPENIVFVYVGQKNLKDS